MLTARPASVNRASSRLGPLNEARCRRPSRSPRDGVQARRVRPGPLASDRRSPSGLTDPFGCEIREWPARGTREARGLMTTLQSPSARELDQFDELAQAATPGPWYVRS